MPGSAGTVGTANVQSREIRQLYDCVEEADCERLQARVASVRAAIQSAPTIPGLKALVAHYRNDPQWLIVLAGAMEIGLQDGSSRVFRAGDHFYSADVLPAGAVFDSAVHGHWSRQLGDEPLVTVFVKG